MAFGHEEIYKNLTFYFDIEENEELFIKIQEILFSKGYKWIDNSKKITTIEELHIKYETSSNPKYIFITEKNKKIHFRFNDDDPFTTGCLKNSEYKPLSYLGIYRIVLPNNLFEM